jgi:hypothetical protein
MRAQAKRSEADRGPISRREGAGKAARTGRGRTMSFVGGGGTGGGGGVVTEVVFKCEGWERGDVDDISKIKKTLFLVFVGQ